MQIKFTLEEWVSWEMVRILPPMKEFEISDEFSESEKKDFELRNKERISFKCFIDDLKVKKKEGKEISTDLIEAPKTKFYERQLLNKIKELANENIYNTLLKNNNIPSYKELVNNLTDDHRRRNGVIISLNLSKNEDLYLDIFRHAIMICQPSEIQSTFEYLIDEYEEAEKLDSKEATKEKIQEIQFNFHKSLRQVDPLGNPHAEMIIHSLMNLTSLPHRAIRAVIAHVKEEKTF